MLILSDRNAIGEQLRTALQSIGPCRFAPLRQVALPQASSIIICDAALDPPQSIAETYRALASTRRHGGPPVLFLLRDPSLLTEELARLAGASAVLRPPMTIPTVVSMVRTLLGGQSAAPATFASTTETRAAANDVEQVLLSIYTAGARNCPLPMVNMAHAGAIVLRTVHEVGIRPWLEAVRRHDDATYRHSLLVAGLAAAFALELGLPPRQQRQLSKGALVHDVGKAQIPLAILNKPGRLLAEEMARMRTHPVLGYEMLKAQAAVDPILLAITRHHHEMLDGSGYPDGIVGAQIPRLVRMVTLCDIYAALIEHRPYRAAMSPTAALAELETLGPKLDQPLLLAFRAMARSTIAKA